MCSFLWGGTTIEQEHHTLVASTARFRATHAHGLGACYKCSATPLHNMGLNRHVQNPSKITESQLDTTPYMEHTQGYTAYHCRFDSHVDQSRNVLRLAIQYFPLILSEKMSQCATLFFICEFGYFTYFVPQRKGSRKKLHHYFPISAHLKFYLYGIGILKKNYYMTFCIRHCMQQE